MSKSDKHIELAQKALVWLECRATGRGVKGCEEVILSDGYVADSVGICGLTIANEKIFGITGNRHSGSTADDFVFIFESKVSKNDFRNTFYRKGHKGDRLLPIGNFHFVVTPKKMIDPADVPAFWGLLEESGAGLRIVKMPALINVPLSKLYEIGYLVLRSSTWHKFTLWTDVIDKYRKECSEGLFTNSPH